MVKMINIAQPKVAKKSFAKVKLAEPRLSKIQLKSIELTCGYYGWSYRYFVENGKSRLLIVIDDVIHEVKVRGRDFIGFAGGREINISEWIKTSRKFAEAGIFKMPKRFNKETFDKMLWESVSALVGITPILQVADEYNE